MKNSALKNFFSALFLCRQYLFHMEILIFVYTLSGAILGKSSFFFVPLRLRVFVLKILN